MKLLPQYSIRLMLGITAALAGVFSIVGLAVRGHGWAIGVSLVDSPTRARPHEHTSASR